MSSSLLFALLLGLEYALADDCIGKPDGSKHEIGCRAYYVCHSNVGIEHHCPDPPATHTVYNSLIQGCDDPKRTPAPCGLWRNCAKHLNRRYADLEKNCTSYYTCQNEIYFGHNFCNAGLVFDESMQICNWPVNVSPPCGTKH